MLYKWKKDIKSLSLGTYNIIKVRVHDDVYWL